MEYRCKLVQSSSLIVGSNGIILPLCDSCGTKDCSNPIENMVVSILGIKRQIKMFNRGNEPKLVIDCDGFTEK